MPLEVGLCGADGVIQQPAPAFSGSGNSLTGPSRSGTSNAKGKGRETAAPQPPAASWGSGGQTLGRPTAAPRAVGAGGASVPVLPNRGRPARNRSPSPESEPELEGYDSDEYIDIDSD